MFKPLVVLCGLSLAGSMYWAGWHHPHHDSSQMEPCCEPLTVEAALLKSDDITGMFDVKNKKCAVSGHDPMGPDIRMAYEGKVYHLCCEGCIDQFKAEPAKFVKLVMADPVKYGVPQH